MKYDRISRRLFLQGAGGFTLAMPLLPSLIWKQAQAQPVQPIKRILHFSMALGSLRPTDEFGSQYKNTNLVQPKTQAGIPHTIHEGSLMNFQPENPPFGVSGGLSSVFGPRFYQNRQWINMLLGMDRLVQSVHHRGHTLGNFHQNVFWRNRRDPAKPQVPSLTEIIAQFPDTYAGVTPSFKSVQFPDLAGNQTISEGYADLSLYRNPTGIHTDDLVPTFTLNRNLALAWDQLGFAGMGSGPTGGGGQTTKSVVVDKVLDDYRAARTRVGQADRPILENWIQFLFEAQSRLNATQPASCAPPTRPLDRRIPREASAADKRIHLASVVDIIQALFICDLTRVVTGHFLWGSTLGTESNNGFWHREYSHGENHAMLADQWSVPMNDGIGLLIERLASTPDIDGSNMIANIFGWHEAEHSFVHSDNNLRLLTFGGLAGKIMTGKFIDYTRRNGPVAQNGEGFGIPVNGFMAGLLEAFGVPPNGEFGYKRHDPNDNTFGACTWPVTEANSGRHITERQNALTQAQVDAGKVPTPGLFNLS